MATKAQVESLMRENAELKEYINKLQTRNIEVIDKLKASYNSEIARLKADLRPATIGDVKQMIDEAVSRLSLSSKMAPWDSDDGTKQRVEISLSYGDDQLSQTEV